MMLDYVDYINDILKKNVSNDYLSSLLTYKCEEGEKSVYDLIEAYYSMLDSVQKDIYYFKSALRRGVDMKTSVLFEDMNITDVFYDEKDDSYVFSLTANTPIRYNIKLRLRRLNDKEEIDNKEKNSRGELILRDNANNYSCYELSIVDSFSIDTFNFAIATLFYENIDEGLFSLLEKISNSYYKKLTYYPKVDSRIPMIIELYNGKIEMNYAGSNNRISICEIDKDKNLHMMSIANIARNCEELAPLANDLVWFLENIYVTENNYMKDVLSQYYYDGKCILDSILLRAGYGSTSGLRNKYSWSEDENRYFIRNEENKIEEIKYYSSVRKNGNETYTFNFFDGSVLNLPASEVINVLSKENNPKSLALLTLKGRL